MNAELAARVESLEAERLRPVPPAPPTRVMDLSALAALQRLWDLADALGDVDGEGVGE